MGFIQTQVILYNVNAEPKKANKEGKNKHNKKKKMKSEPRDCNYIKFCLN